MMKPEGRGEWTHKLCDLGIPGGCVIATYQPRGLLVWFDLDIRKHHSFNWMFGRWTFIFIFHPCYDPDGQGQTGNQLAAGNIMYWSSKYWRVPRCPSQFWVSRLWPAPLPNVFGMRSIPSLWGSHTSYILCSGQFILIRQTNPLTLKQHCLRNSFSKEI